MRTVLGIESFLHQADIRSTERWGLILNQASLLPNGHYVFDALLEKLNVTAFFSPQHGLFGHTQDNMIEWSGGTFRGIPVYSLYSTTRKPLPEQLAQIDTFLFDVQDVGSRYYTFIWTLFLVMQAAAETQKRVVVCDRPNPIAPFALAGPPQNPDFLSFVGLQPLPIIHQMTVGEIAGYFQKNFFPELELQIFTMKNWNRSMFYEQTGLHWFMPSPNMPTVETATVYPGMCLLEATNISEGRGTTRPFEFFGAAYFHHEESQRSSMICNFPVVISARLLFSQRFRNLPDRIAKDVLLKLPISKSSNRFTSA